MTPTAFGKLAQLHKLKGKSLDAARLVMVNGISAYRAAHQLGLAESTVSRALSRLARPLCPACNQPLKTD